MLQNGKLAIQDQLDLVVLYIRATLFEDYSVVVWTCDFLT